MLRRIILICGLILLLVPLAWGGQGKSKGKGKDRDTLKSGVNVFVDLDRWALREYAAGFRGGNLPPGLAKRGGGLPPGLEKQLVRKGHLPPGLEKKLVPFPPEVERRMAPLAPGLERGFIGGHAVILNSSTRLIVDVFIPLD